jgi:ribonuclease III
MQEQETVLLELAQKIGVSEPQQLRRALIHSSFANENPEHSNGHNERLEFLGDAVLSLCVSHLLMEREPSATEGHLSKLRSSLVDEATLAKAAKRLGLGAALLLGKGEENSGGREKPSLLANTYEAVIAAIYLTDGFPRAMSFVREQFTELLEELLRSGRRRDYKTRLQELIQRRYSLSPMYVVVDTMGPEHAKIFKVSLLVKEVFFTHGEGRSKKEAEQKAAEYALALIDDGWFEELDAVLLPKEPSTEEAPKESIDGAVEVPSPVSTNLES